MKRRAQVLTELTSALNLQGNYFAHVEQQFRSQKN